MRITLYLLVLSIGFSCIFLPKQSTAQTNDIIDSLLVELENSQDTTRVTLLNDLSIEYAYVDVDKVIAYAREAESLAIKLGYKPGQGRAIWNLGYNSHLQGDYQQAEAHHLAALKILEPLGGGSFLRAVYSELGQIYSSQGAYQKSLDYFKKGLDISKKLKNDINVGTVIFGMASSYSALGNFSKAFEILEEGKPLIQHRPHLIYYYAILGDLHNKSGSTRKGLVALQQSAALCAELTDTLRLAYMYEAIGKTYTDLADYENAMEYYLKSIKINESLGISSLELVCQLGLGNLFRLWGDSKKAKQYYTAALKNAEANELNVQVTEAHLGLGMLAMKQENYPTAKEHFEKSLALAKASNAPNDVINSYLNLSDIYLFNQKYADALAALSEAKKFIPDEKDLQAHFHFAILSKKGEVYLKKANYQQSITTLLAAMKYADGEEDQHNQKSNFKNLSIAYDKIGDHQSALEHFKKYTALKESEEHKLNSELITEMRTRFETEEKQKEVEILEQKTEIQSLNFAHQSAELKRKESHVILMGLLLLLASGLFWSLFSRFKWRKESEQLRLKKQQVELEKKHLETNQQLEFAELRSRVFTNISHEFRTSLTLILSPLESIISGLEKCTPDMHQMMHRHANKLLDLVNQTLDLAKLESGHMPLSLEHCAINQFVKDIALNFSPLAEVKHISLNLEAKNEKKNIAVDKTKLEKALSNLLSNAFEHSPAHSEIQLILSEDSPDTLLIEVKDSGIGIPSEHLPYIFDRFYQVDKNSARGTGIGLALVKEIVDLHGGQVRVESQEGQGTSFSISLPTNLEIAAPETSASPAAPLSSTLQLTANDAALSLDKVVGNKEKRLNILVVEDHPEVQNYIVSGLTKKGNIITASDGEEALALARKILPDIIVCDVMMPKMQGFELTEILKSELPTSHIPIILLTAKASPTSTLSGLKAGADDYLTKPFNMEELQLRVHNQIEQRRRLRALFSAKREVPVSKITLNKLDEEFLERALSVAKEHLAEADFTVEKFAHEMGMSRTNLYTKLKPLTGKNISGFIRTLRIQKAAELIRSQSGNMNEIAYRIGFNNRQSFIKAFKHEMSKTPSEFKKTIGLVRTRL